MEQADRGKLAGRVAIVTGSGSGIGLAIARAFAAHGARVMIGEFSEERGAAAVREIERAGGRASFSQVDVSRWDDVDRLVGETVREFGGLDIMVNNAGVLDGYATCLETTEALFDRVLAIDVKGVFFGCKRALAEMVDMGYGKIINLASVAGLQARAGGLAYTTAKHAVVGLTREVAYEYGPKGIRVNAICPGVIVTQLRATSPELLGGTAPSDFTGRGLGALSDEDFRQMVPLGYKGQPEDIARAALFLASPDSDYLNGHALVVDGGFTVQ